MLACISIFLTPLCHNSCAFGDSWRVCLLQGYSMRFKKEIFNKLYITLFTIYCFSFAV